MIIAGVLYSTIESSASFIITYTDFILISQLKNHIDLERQMQYHL